MIERTTVAPVPVAVGAMERWRGECACGWRGEPHLTQFVARAEVLEHDRSCSFQLQLELVA